MEEMGNAYRILVGRPKGKRPLERPKCRWKDNIRMDIREIRCAGVDWMHLDQNRHPWQTLVNTIKSLQFHKWPGNS
jgi:hypothetical protein